MPSDANAIRRLLRDMEKPNKSDELKGGLSFGSMFSALGRAIPRALPRALPRAAPVVTRTAPVVTRAAPTITRAAPRLAPLRGPARPPPTSSLKPTTVTSRTAPRALGRLGRPPPPSSLSTALSRLGTLGNVGSLGLGIGLPIYQIVSQLAEEKRAAQYRADQDKAQARADAEQAAMNEKNDEAINKAVDDNKTAQDAATAAQIALDTQRQTEADAQAVVIAAQEKQWQDYLEAQTKANQEALDAQQAASDANARQYQEALLLALGYGAQPEPEPYSPPETYSPPPPSRPTIPPPTHAPPTDPYVPEPTQDAPPPRRRGRGMKRMKPIVSGSREEIQHLNYIDQLISLFG